MIGRRNRPFRARSRRTGRAAMSGPTRSAMSRRRFLGGAAAGVAGAALGASGVARASNRGDSDHILMDYPEVGDVTVYPLPAQAKKAPTDVKNIQWAFDNVSPDRTVYLMAHDINGNPNDFNFGVVPEYPCDPAGQVTQEFKDFNIIGEPGTTISGGGGNRGFFYSGVINIYRGKVTIKNIIFDQPSFVAITLDTAHNSLIENITVIGRKVTFPPGYQSDPNDPCDLYTIETAIGIFTIFCNEVIVRGNTVGVPGNDVARGIFPAGCFKGLFEENIIQSHWAGIILNNSQENTVQNNHVNGCNCIYGYWQAMDYDAGLVVYESGRTGLCEKNKLLNNTVTGASYGIRVLGSHGDTFSDNTLNSVRKGVYLTPQFGKTIQNCKFFLNIFGDHTEHDLYFESGASNNYVEVFDEECDDLICVNYGTNNTVVDADGDLCPCSN